MDYELVCNFRRCRKRLNTFAWTTSCSHIFCDEDGLREFKKKVCPACETPLPGKYDIGRIDLQPTEQYKSMLLAGQKPDVIMETCSRALAFWTYQAQQERVYQEFITNKAKEKNQQLESYYEGTIQQLKGEINSFKSQSSALKADLEATRRKYSEVSEKLTEKNRQYQKLQGLYDGMKRRNITPYSFEGEVEGAPHIIPRFIPSRHDMRTGTIQDDMMLSQRTHMVPMGGDNRPLDLDFRRLSPRNSPPQKDNSKDFVLRPNTTPIPIGFSVINDRDRMTMTAQGQSHHPYKKH